MAITAMPAAAYNDENYDFRYPVYSFVLLAGTIDT